MRKTPFPKLDLGKVNDHIGGGPLFFVFLVLILLTFKILSWTKEFYLIEDFRMGKGYISRHVWDLFYPFRDWERCLNCKLIFSERFFEF